jgi:hypothetical protein
MLNLFQHPFLGLDRSVDRGADEAVSSFNIRAGGTMDPETSSG